MPFAKLVIIQPGHASRELKVETDLVTIGRALDNLIALEDDSNVSRYHAELESRSGDFWLVDLESRNGTTVNDQAIDLERQLEDGDLICIGGSSMIEFHLSEIPWESHEEPRAESLSGSEKQNAPPSPSVNLASSAGNVATSSVRTAEQLPGVTAPSTGLSPIYIG
jgi:pSer/pThr/pTyr-binding forkhead associated (FHA) protein